jgi:Tol biopolymer transport system component/tRNA A-37 threonylcarbamoyl transferase component Bud32
MTLIAGDKLGPYEIIELIGKGGMGEVYRARDTRLDRIVAVKVSKEKFSARFEREARAVAALNHPHICTLYDVGPNYLVMEYIEGAPVKGPLPLEQALKYAAQICDALDAAHSKGITHRDLKPGNILVTKSAGVKLLDFGLAKQSRDRKGGEDDETLTMAVTGTGQIVGTLYYMSPEQLQGQEAGPESDIFSFGLVLYEILTGKRAFDGKTTASVIAAIMERPAPSVVDVAPAVLDRALSRCLEKDPQRRWRSAWDLKAELEWIGTDRPVAVAARKGFGVGRMLPWALAVLLALALGFVAYRRTSEEAPRVLKMSVLLPDKALPVGPAVVPAVSPDGKSIAFGATVGGKRQLWVRDLDSLAAHPLAGTEGGGTVYFWSPDSRWIGFANGRQLEKIETSGGRALPICRAESYSKGSWGKDYIVFGTLGGIRRVPVSGGEPTIVVPAREGIEVSSPWFLPDGRHFLYAAFSADSQQTVIYAGDVEAKNPSENGRKVLDGGASVAYSDGYILFVRDGTLMAQRFDTESLQTQGDAAAVPEQVGRRGNAYSVSQNGILAYSSGGVTTTQLTWYSREGQVVGTVGTPGFGLSAAVSPDGSTVAFDRTGEGVGLGGDVWLLDPRGSESRFTFGGGQNFYPVWSPEGTRIAYYSRRGATGAVYVKSRNGTATNGADDAQPLHKTLLGDHFPSDWSRDGQYIVEEVDDPKTHFDIWVAPLAVNQAPFVYLNSEFNESQPKLSPNGQWLAYVSNETLRNEVYLQAFPKPGGKTKVSTKGGDLPLWSRDGKELYYITPDRKLVAVEIKGSGNSIQLGATKVLFPVRMGFAPAPGTLPILNFMRGFAYDVTKDGRFLIPSVVEKSEDAAITVVVNWMAGLKK